VSAVKGATVKIGIDTLKGLLQLCEEFISEISLFRCFAHSVDFKGQATTQTASVALSPIVWEQLSH
jgi:hypothetical protein